jgi:hypothetical protein
MSHVAWDASAEDFGQKVDLTVSEDLTTPFVFFDGVPWTSIVQNSLSNMIPWPTRDWFVF